MYVELRVFELSIAPKRAGSQDLPNEPNESPKIGICNFATFQGCMGAKVANDHRHGKVAILSFSHFRKVEVGLF